MQITEVTVSWTETADLGNYSNVRPSLSLKATLDPQEYGAAHIYNELMAQCKAFVQEQVDLALEAEGQAAKYSSDPRFDIFYSGYRSKVVAIVPAGVKVEGASCAMRKHRYDAALRFAADRYEGMPLFICVDGDTTAVAAAIAAAEAENERIAEIQRVEREAAWERERVERQQSKAAQVPAGEVDPFDDGDDDNDDE